MQPLRGKYLIGEPFGRGGTGLVRRGRDAAGNEVVVKTIHTELIQDPGVYAAMLQLWPIFHSLRGPNLVTVREMVTEGDTMALVMENVPGTDLAELLHTSGPLLPAEVARIGADLADGLAQAHAQNIVHGDLKPKNILLEAQGGSPKIADFQVAWTLLGTKSAARPDSAPYAAPELLQGGAPTGASDVYALGVLLYEMSCCVTPFAADTVRDVISGHTLRYPGKPTGIADELWGLIQLMLDKAPANRPRAEIVAATLREMSDRLLAFPTADRLDRPPQGASMGASPTIPAMPVAFPSTPQAKKGKPVARRIVAVVGAVAVIGAGIWFFSDASDTPSTTVAGGSTGTTTPGAVTRTTTASLTRSSQALAEMPKLVGLTLGEARDLLPASVKIEVEEVVDPGAKDGTVTRQDPEPGAEIPATVKLTVARPLIKVYLDSQQPARGNWYEAPAVVSVAGETVPHSLVRQVSSCYELQSVEYALSRGYRKLTVKAGLTDDSADAAVEVQLEIFADDRQVYTGLVKYNAIAAIDLDMTGVNRLKFQWQPTKSKNDCLEGKLALGEATLLGAAGEIPTSGLRPTATTTTTTTR